MPANFNTIVDRDHRWDVGDLVRRCEVGRICRRVDRHPRNLRIILRQLGNNGLDGLAGAAGG